MSHKYTLKFLSERVG